MATPYSENDIGIVKMAAAASLAAIVVATLYFGRDVFVPIALAIILSFVLAPLTRLFHGWGLPRSLSVMTVVFVAFAAIFVLGELLRPRLVS